MVNPPPPSFSTSAFKKTFPSLRFYLDVALRRGAAGLILVWPGVLKAPPVVQSGGGLWKEELIESLRNKRVELGKKGGTLVIKRPRTAVPRWKPRS